MSRSLATTKCRKDKRRYSMVLKGDVNLTFQNHSTVKDQPLWDSL